MVCELFIEKVWIYLIWPYLKLMEWGQFISVFLPILSASVALFTSIAAWRAAKASENSALYTKNQAYETFQQRLGSVHPDIYIENGKYYLVYEERLGFGRFQKEIESDLPNVIDLYVYLGAINLGNGHAKNVEILWEFEVDKYVEYIRENQKSNHKYIVDYNKGKEICFSESSSITLDKQFKESMRIMIKEKNYDVQLPYLYTALLAILIQIFFEKECNRIESSNVPVLNFTLRYQDMYGTPYISNHKLIPKINELEGSRTDDYKYSYMMQVKFEIEEARLEY